MLGVVLVMGTLSITAGLTHGLMTGDVWGGLAWVVGITLPYIPAVWVFAGVTVLAVGLIPRIAAVAPWPYTSPS